MIAHDSIDINGYVEEERHKFLTASVVPRPIALVSSTATSGIVNVAPFSQLIICVTPPLLGIVVHHTADRRGYADEHFRGR